MLSLGDYKLLLPQKIPKEEWSKSIEQLEGCAKEAAILQAKGYNLLEEIEESKATPERIGWLNLWAKTYTVLESAMSAFEYRSDFVLQVISRSTFEWGLHAHVLIEPITDLNADISAIERKSHKKFRVTSRIHLKQCVDRLRAYTAWCLWSDKVHYDAQMDPKKLRGVWDPSPAREILADKKRLEIYERLFGKLEVEVDEDKLKQGRAEMEYQCREKIDRIDQWLSDPDLKPWADKIKSLTKGNKRHVSFFALFDESPTTVWKRLQKHEISFAYSLYSISSMVLHGSTMEQFITIRDSDLAPKIKPDDSNAEKIFGEVIGDCNHIFVLLGAIDHFVLNRTELRGCTKSATSVRF
ncbi:MAG: hypothetical protein J7M27_02955 [Candidatus Latescibacteria bacterium]|nr:hypothetical protein [Candidatus Latescibacterota bacterium]